MWSYNQGGGGYGGGYDQGGGYGSSGSYDKGGYGRNNANSNPNHDKENKHNLLKDLSKLTSHQLRQRNHTMKLHLHHSNDIYF